MASASAVPVLAARGEAALDPESCRDLYRTLTSGVSVVTALGDDGPVGMTASTVTAVSLTPPLLLVCVHAGSRTLTHLRRRNAFGVHVLGADQAGLARRMAAPGHTSGLDLGYREVGGVPVLPACLAWSVCGVEDVRTYGDHAVVVGRVVDAEVSGGRPLLWRESAFCFLADRVEPLHVPAEVVSA